MSTEMQKLQTIIKKYGSDWSKHLDEMKEDKNQIKVGDIFYASWGYDQTNYDYIVVVEMSKTGKTAICQRAEHDHLGCESQCNIQKPTNRVFGDKFRMKVDRSNYKEEAQLRGSYPFLHTGTGSKRFDFFWKVSKNETFAETHPSFGH